MMFFPLFVALLIIIILSFLLPKAKRNGKNNLPPGPIGLPFIGNLHQFDSLTPHLYFWKLSKKYGKIFTLKFGSTPIVVVSSANLAKEVTQIEDLAFCSSAADVACAPASAYVGRCPSPPLDTSIDIRSALDVPKNLSLRHHRWHVIMLQTCTRWHGKPPIAASLLGTGLASDESPVDIENRRSSTLSAVSILGQQKLSYNGQDIALSPYNDYWKELQKICVVHLLSLKKVHSFSPIREDEVSRMIKKISQQAATLQISNLSSIVISLTTIIICRVAFGIRYDEETCEGRKFDELLKVTEEMLAGFFVSDYFPLLGWIDKFSGKINRLERNFKDLDEFYEGLIEQHLKPNKPKSMEGDIIDLLLQLKEEKSTPIDLTLDNIKAIIMDMLVGGTDTSAATIIWAMTALIANPNAMKKVQAEIRESVGKKSIVNQDDIQNLLYFKAVIKEAFRLYPPAPLLLPRETMRNSILEGYEIKPKTIVLVNTWAIARDPEIWKN